MKRLLELLLPLSSLPEPQNECFLPTELWVQVAWVALEQQWASAKLQAGLVGTLNLVSKQWHQKVLPGALGLLRAASFLVVECCGLGTSQRSFLPPLTPDRVQLVSLNFTEMKDNAHYPTLSRKLLLLTNLTALQLQGVTKVPHFRHFPDLRRLSSLRALSLIDSSLPLDMFGRIPLVELRISAPSGERQRWNALGDAEVSQLTCLRSLSVPGQNHLTKACLRSLTQLEQLNISGVQWGTPTQRLNALKPLTRLKRLRMDGNDKDDARSWAEAQVARWLRSVTELTVTGIGKKSAWTYDYYRDAENALMPEPSFPQYCQFST